VSALRGFLLNSPSYDVGIHEFTPIQGPEALVEFIVESCHLGSAYLVALFHKAKGLANDFAGRGVTTGGDLLYDKFVELRGQGNVHKNLYSIVDFLWDNR
jgi:hypothetical protein